MNTTNYIRIFRGDDSDALGYQTIVGTIKTDIDLAGCKAVFRFLGFYAEFNPIPDDKKLTIVIPAQASRGFPPGVGYASLKVIDTYGKIRTFTNRIPVIVDTMTPSCGCGEFEVSFSPFPELEPLKIFIGPNADDFDQYTGFVSKIIDRASLVKYGLVMLADAMSEDGGASGKAASPLAVKAAYDAIIKELTDNYYNAEQTEEAIDRVAAYYITRNAAGDAFETKTQLDSTTVFYSGGSVRVPTRNDYCVVLADETHSGAEYRYIYAVAEGETTGSWQPQFPVEGVMTVDQTVQKNSQNPVSGGGVWSAIWGALAALPTGFSSLYDWCASQLSGKLSLSGGMMTGDVSFASGAVIQDQAPGLSISGPGVVPNVELWEFFPGAPDAVVRAKELAGKQNMLSTQQLANIAAVSDALAFDAMHPYAAGDPVVYNGTLYTFTAAHTGAWTGSDVSAVDIIAMLAGKLDKSGGMAVGTFGVLDPEYPDGVPVFSIDGTNSGLPTMRFGDSADVVGIKWHIVDGGVVMDVTYVFGTTYRIALPLASGTLALLQNLAPAFSTSATYALDALCIYEGKVYRCTIAVTTAGAWTGSTNWTEATVEDVLAMLRTEMENKVNAPLLYSNGNLASFDNNGDLEDSGINMLSVAVKSDLNTKLDSTSAAPAFSSDSSTQYAVGAHVTYNGKLYKCTTATTGGTWDASKWTADTMTDPDAVLDITAQNQLRVVAKDGTLLWAQGYDLASTSSATLACDATNNFTFADGATTQAFTLPTAPTGKVGDFGLDIDNSANTGAATMTLTGLDTTFSVVVPEGESLNDMLAIAAGELARFYITLSTFRVNNLPTWHIVKQVVENGGATV